MAGCYAPCFWPFRSDFEPYKVIWTAGPMSKFPTRLFHAAQVGAGPLNTPSFTQQNADGVIDIPATAYVTIDASGPDVLLTSQLTGGLCLLQSLAACLP